MDYLAKHTAGCRCTESGRRYSTLCELVQALVKRAEDAERRADALKRAVDSVGIPVDPEAFDVPVEKQTFGL